MARFIVELFLPLIFSNTIHMVIVKKDLLAFLKVPLNQKIFGKNKTYRGFIVLMTFTSFFQVLISSFIFDESIIKAVLLGALLGFVYALFELPNSFYKRSIGISSGESPRELKFILLDKMDSTFGVSLVYSWIKNLDIFYFFVLFFLAFFTHLSLSVLLHKIRLKESL